MFGGLLYKHKNDGGRKKLTRFTILKKSICKGNVCTFYFKKDIRQTA